MNGISLFIGFYRKQCFILDRYQHIFMFCSSSVHANMAKNMEPKAYDEDRVLWLSSVEFQMKLHFMLIYIDLNKFKFN